MTTPNQSPLVTVVIPTIDRPELLARAVQSVFSQDYDGPIDCLIVFDGPSQPPPAVLTTAGRTLRAITNTRSPGLAGARNSGLTHAHGSLIAFLDDDDEWMPGKLRRQVHLLEPDAGTAAVGCGNVVVYEGRETTRDAPCVVTFQSLLRSRVAVLHSSTILVRRDALDTIGLIDERIPAGASEDYEWQLRVARHGPIAMVQEPLARVHWHTGSRFSRHWVAFIDGLTYVLARNPEFRQYPRGASRIYGQIAFGYAAMGMTRETLRWAGRCLSADWRQPRGYLSLLVATRILPAEMVLRGLHTRGKGI
jgi:glycosyltransferase involved in cell wall biosynthesis